MGDEAESIFKVFDKDFDGKLQALEMHQALGAAGLCPAIEDVQLALKDGGGTGDSQFYKRLQQQFADTKPTPQSLKPLFKVVDPSGSGKVEVSSLLYLLTNFNEKLSHAEAKEFVCDLLGLPEQGAADTDAIADKLSKLIS